MSAHATATAGRRLPHHDHRHGSAARATGGCSRRSVLRARELSILRRAGRAGRRDGACQLLVPVGAGRQGHLPQRLDPRPPRRRPDDGRDHPQHRPVGRVGGRPGRRSPAGTLLSGPRPPNVVVVLVLGMALGAACGLVNGVLVSFFRVPALVVTLGTLYVIQGAAYYWAHGRRSTPRRCPTRCSNLGNGSVLGIPYLPLITVVVMLAVGHYLRAYRSGREFYAIGSSPEAARLAGLPHRPARPHRVHLQRRARRAGRRAVAAAVRDRRRGRRHRLGAAVVAAVVVGGVAIFGGSAACTAPRSAPCCSPHQRVLIVLKVDAFWQQPPSARCCCSPSRRPPARPAASRPRAAKEERPPWRLTPPAGRPPARRRAGRRTRRGWLGRWDVLSSPPCSSWSSSSAGALGRRTSRPRDYLSFARVADLSEIALIALPMTLRGRRRRGRPVGRLRAGPVERAARRSCGTPGSPVETDRRRSASWSARLCGAGQRLARHPARAAVAGRHHRHADAVPRARLRRLGDELGADFPQN